MQYIIITATTNIITFQKRESPTTLNSKHADNNNNYFSGEFSEILNSVQGYGRLTDAQYIMSDCH